MAARVKICLAGQFGLEVDGAVADASHLGPLGTVALAFLVSERHRPVPKDELAEVIWGEDLPATWEASLRALLSRIRRRLEEVGVPGDVLASSRGSYQLRLPSGVAVDVEEAENAVEEARGALAEGDWQRAAQLSEAAADVAARPFLSGAGGLWAERRQAALHGVHVDALEVLSEAASAAGDHPAAIAAADAAVAAEPLRESAHVRAMTARAAAGKRAEALRAYERCRRLLVEELGVPPSPSTEAAYVALLDDEPPSTNLGAELSSFVGRADQLRDVQKLLGTSRLVTLVGPAGVGKTRLAKRVATGMVEHYRDGAWMVELAALADPALLAQHVVSTLGVSGAGRSTPPEALRRHLADKQLLLVMDNCEHIVAACAGLLRDLLAACKGLVVLATSRAPLGVSGESLWPVPPLSVPPSEVASAEQLGESEAVRLFVEHATAADPSFVLSHDNAAAVGDICRDLDGLPLAIELAAARTRSLSVQDVIAHLRDRFRLLVGSDLTAPDRHRTLRAAVDWSYGALSVEEQRLFRCVSAFAGGFTLDAAAAVSRWDRADVLDGLAGLVDKSLVGADRSGSSTRYRLLETLRQYGAEQLTACGEEAVVRAAHLAWICAMVEEAEPELEGADQQEWLRRLDSDEDNVRVALDWSISHADGSEGLRAGGGLWRYWQVRGRFEEGLRWLRALIAADSGTDPAARAKALGSAAILLLTQSTETLTDGEAHDAGAWFEESLALRRQIGDRRGAASTLHGLGGMYYRRGNTTRAQACFRETLAIGRELGEKRLVAASLVNLASIDDVGLDRSAPNWRDARPLLEEAVGLYRELGDLYATARALTDLSVLANRDGDNQASRALLTEAADIQRALGDLRGLVVSTAGLGELARRAADFEEARARLEEALAIAHELRSPLAVARELTRLGYLAWMQGDLTEAKRCYREAVVVARPLDQKSIFRIAQEGLAGLFLVEGDIAEARRMYDEVEAEAEKANDLTPGSPWRFAVLAMLALAEGDHVEAVRQGRRAFEGDAKTPLRPNVVLLNVLAVLVARAGDLHRSAQFVGAADTSRSDPFSPFRSGAWFEPVRAVATAFPSAYNEGAALGRDAAFALARTALDELEQNASPTI